MFDVLGLDPLSEKVYRALLLAPNRTTDDIAKELDEPCERIGRVVEVLKDFSLIRGGSASTGHLRPVSPDIGLRALLSQHEAELLGRRQQVEQSRASLNRLVAEYADLQAQQTGSSVERLENVDSVRDRLEQLAAATRSEQLAFVRTPVTQAGQTTARPVDEEVIGRGVAMRTVFLDSVRHDPTTMGYAQWLEESGAQVRTVPVLDLRMVIYDRSFAVLPLDPEDSTRGAIVLQGTGIIVALVALFERVWSSAVPVMEQSRTDEDGLRPAEQELLRQLAQGATDEAVARRLGVSLRTVRRIMSEITERLGARGRFQTAVRAMERGWL